MDKFDLKNINSLVQSKSDDLVRSVTTNTGSLLSGVTGLGSQLTRLSQVNDFVSGVGLNKVQLGSGGKKQTVDTLRVRLRAQDGRADQVYGKSGADNILSLLHATNGMLFPYTPSIEWSQDVEYTPMSLTHANQDFYSYKNTPSISISLTGDFTVQNQREGEYMLAVIHFLRTVSKMYFGKQAVPDISGANVKSSSGVAGMPPPVLIFSGYGNYMFNDLPVIVKGHSYSLGKEVDYLDVQTASGVARLPSLLTVSLRLVVQNTPKSQREDFNLDKFRTGEMMRTNKGWI